MKANYDDTPDYLLNERIQMLQQSGYCGFVVQNITENPKKEEVVIEAKNPEGKFLTASGDSSEDACRQLIDLIDTTVDDI
ncbi:MAG: hypothetical protein R6V27_03780 [Balneolaceae bacterium]